ncbi:16370_t:CDS:2 [Acaulospora morrowiae]|uniref:16370_t:CDS:1 n=1 Tax=Acaulospora morrowiae TaxID=94023 RepID=A0A9N9F1N5_9GLOM|nr:16370_t:CDS:2 [Acaulospora morrowiae]
MSSQCTLHNSLRDTTPKYNDNLVARNNGKIIKKTTTVKKTTTFKRPMPISSRKADITLEINILNHKHLKSMSVLEANTTDVSMKGNLSDTEVAKYFLHLTKYPGKTTRKKSDLYGREWQVVTITDVKEACTDPISEFKNSKPRLASTLNIYETNHKSVKICNIPQYFSKRDITTGATKFSSIEYIQMQTTGPHKSAVVIFTYQSDYNIAINDWSVTIEDSMTAQDLSDIMQQVSTKVCYISQTNKMCRRFASLNFTSQKDLTKAIATRTAKLCHYCGDTQHMIANCNVKPPNNTCTRYGTHSRDRFSTYREETHYNNGNQYRNNGFNRSYADITRGTNINCSSNGMLLALVHYIQETITEVQHQISQLEKRVSILEEDAVYRYITITETEDIKTTQNQINEKLNKMEEMMAQFAELFNNNLSDQNSCPDLTSIQQ